MAPEQRLQKLTYLNQQIQSNPQILFEGIISEPTPDWAYLKELLQEACLQGTDTHYAMPTIIAAWSEAAIFASKQSATSQILAGRATLMTIACTFGAVLLARQNMIIEILAASLVLLFGSYLASSICLAFLPRPWFWFNQEFTTAGKSILTRLLRPNSPAGISPMELASINAAILAQRNELALKEKKLAMVLPIFELLTMGAPPACFGGLLGVKALLDGN